LSDAISKGTQSIGTHARPRLIVDIVSDPVCPWCFVGLQSWKKAKLALEADFEVITRMRPYQLNPDTPLEGKDRVKHYEKKFRDKKFLEEMLNQLVNASERAGAKFDPMGPKWLPNTLNAHRVKRWAHFVGLQDELADRLYTAFWKENGDIGSVEGLTQIVVSAGMDGDRIRKDLDSDKDLEMVREEAEAFRRAGVSGVPTFIINEKHGFSGAQDPETLEQSIRNAAKLVG